MKKKILTISIYVLCVLLAGAILTMSLVKFNSLPSYANPDWISVYVSGSNTPRNISKGTDDYQKLLEKIDESFTSSYISALFRGNANKNYDVNAGTLSSAKPYIVLKFSAKQKLEIAGKVVKNPSKTSEDVEYNEIYILVTENNERKDMLVQYRNSANGSVWYITLEGNVYPIYEYINE